MARLVLRNARRCGVRRTENLVLDGDTILAWCDDIDVRDFDGPGTEVVDLGGRVITAGLTDSHLHPVLGAEQALDLDLSTCRTLDDVRAVIAGAPAGEWVVGSQLDPNCFGTEVLSAAPLSDAFGVRPVMLRLFDGHSAIASAEALRRAGITGSRSFRSASEIACDADGSPTGLLLEEEAMQPVYDVIPHAPFQERRDRLRDVFAAMAATGLTGAHVMDCDGDAPGLFASLDEAGDLPMRLRIAPYRRPEDDDRRAAELVAMQGQQGRLWRIAGVKFFMDGTIDNGTAWLEEPDCLGESRHPYWRDPDEYARAVRDLAVLGIQTATHAIGDAAVAHVLRTVADLPPGARQQHRIEHIETLPDELVPAFVAHAVVASMQPTHATDYTLADHSDNWSRRLGDVRAGHGWRCADLLHAGVTVALGSDWPVAPFDPRIVMAAAQLRRPWNRPDLAPVQPSQTLTAAEALAGYTTAPAVAVGDNRLGQLTPGHLADLTIWAADPLDHPADQLPNLPIAMTVVDGVIRHRAVDL